PAAIAAEYARGGAAAISVVAEPDFFRGSTAWIGEAARASRLPVLMKHFVVDPRQALDGIAAGADAVLLLASLVTTEELASLITTIESLGCDALVEVHDEEELASALAAGATLVGVNNRNLKTFDVDLATAERLAKSIPPGVLRVAESGIRSAADAARMKASGFDAILVGEHLLRQADREAGVRSLRGGPSVKICGITTEEDALAAIDAGASFLGLVFAEGSPRRVRRSHAASIAGAVRSASPRTRLVGVFRDQPLEEMRSIAGDLDLDLVQLHGSEPGSIIPQLGRPAIRAIAMRAPGVSSASGWGSIGDRLIEAEEASWTLFDGKNAGRGETFDWEMIERVPRPRRMFLAGGLTPQNVREAIARVRPDGVDVSSGVEERPGKKSPAKMRQFVDEVNRA
ncbi:MAG TPA: bifunctional indole-3-glycerol phosphate synthase/phosphoribosylanthranilate isomerase, partial [Thermoanaerobaculia bacterium]|nr:bifunctional indole-3-glycerol phosphate synthase/phosphoribosylanthranilate isomerase [Thermoanaerobaculia bacterium]